MLKYPGSTLVFIILTILLSLSLAVSLSLAESQYLLFSEKKRQQIEQQYGVKVAQRLSRWKTFVEQNQDKSELDKLSLTNDFFNQQLLWISDLKLWKQKDYWATPVETLVKAAGDCEDFTIIKYFTLISLGVPVKHLRLTYVKALKYNQAHMVLTYSKTRHEIPLVLDNINKKILPASQRKDLKPVYSFNGEGMWLQSKKKLGKKVGSSSRIRLWTNLKNRMQKELL